MNGYMDRILHVDLSQGRLWDEPVKEDDARDFAGGSGLAARIVCDMVNSETDPLGPHNPIRSVQRLRSVSAHRHLGGS